MRPSPTRDLVVGLFVLAGLGAIAYLSLSIGGVEIGRAARMPLYATFSEIGGLKPRAQVVISGVSVGKVAAIELDESLQARVRLEVEPSLALPVDTSAAIRTSGLLGDQYVALEPGGEDQTLAPGDEIAWVENALSIERLIGKFVHDSGVESSGARDDAATDEPAADAGSGHADAPHGPRERLVIRRALVLAAAIATALSLGSAGPAPAADGPPEVDPWEGFNRPVFAFNEAVDRYALEPVATGFDWVVPHVVQIMIRNAELNAKEPVYFANDLLQGKPLDAATDLARLVLNSSFGFAGLVDVARPLGLDRHEEDFGQTLGVWGVPAGPYLVLPLLGPSSPRDATGRLAEAFSSVYGYYAEWYVSAAIASVQLLNLRALLLEEIRMNRGASFDFYTFVRNAYIQYREQQIRDGGAAPSAGAGTGDRPATPGSGGTGDDLYYPEEDEGGGPGDDLYYPDEGEDDDDASASEQ